MRPADDDLAAYLRRLQLDAEPPSIDALRRLHRAHVELVPYETVWLHLGETRGVEPAESVAHIARGGRGGYCFHLNGALSSLLGALGYNVTRHVGGVHGPDGPEEAAMTNHLVLTVAGLPDDDNPGGHWYVDAGLGDALHEPLPLVPGDYQQGPFHLGLRETPGDVGDWHLVHDPRGGFPGMSFRAAAAAMPDFAERHRFLSTSPESGFVRLVTVQRRDGTGADIMRGLVLQRIGDGDSDDDGDNISDAAPHTRALERRDDWIGALHDVFHLRLDGAAPEAVDRLWERVSANHRAWQESLTT